MIPKTKLKNPLRADYLGYNSRLAGSTSQTQPSQSYPQAYNALRAQLTDITLLLGLEQDASEFPKHKLVISIQEKPHEAGKRDKRYLGVQDEANGKKSERAFDAMPILGSYETAQLAGIVEQIASEARANGANIWRR
jgi:hypothetical protein